MLSIYMVKCATHVAKCVTHVLYMYGYVILLLYLHSFKIILCLKVVPVIILEMSFYGKTQGG